MKHRFFLFPAMTGELLSAVSASIIYKLVLLKATPADKIFSRGRLKQKEFVNFWVYLFEKESTSGLIIARFFIKGNFQKMSAQMFLKGACYPLHRADA